MRTILLTAWLFFFLLQGISAQQVFSREEMLQDFHYMVRALKECHPGLYRYQSKGQVDSLIVSTEKQIGENMSLYGYYALLSQMVASIRCAHTVLTPRENWMGLYFNEVRQFPYQVFFIKDKAYLMVNRTKGREVKPGAELISINGMAIDSIRRTMFRHISADGFNETLKYWQIDNLMFSYYYHLLIGRPETFHIRYRDREGNEREIASQALGIREVDRNTNRNPLNREILKHYPRKNPRRLEIDKDRNVATITLREFFGGGEDSVARLQLRDFLKNCMRQLAEQDIRNLVIDLRNNSGGFDTQGQELLSWLISRPVPYYRRLHTVTRESEFLKYSSVSKEELTHIGEILSAEPDGTFTVGAAFNSGLKKVEPAEGHYTGNVYFLVNGATGSATAEFTAVAKHNGVGKFIGEETGGSYEGGNGNEFVGLVLPRTKMKLSIPLVYYQLAVDPPAERGRGTMPDHAVAYEWEDVMTGRDPYMERVYRLTGK